MQFIDILITFGLLAFVSAGGLWFAKLAILGICGVVGFLVFVSLRKVPLLMWPLLVVIALVMLRIVTIQMPSRRDLHGDPAKEVTMALRQQTWKVCEAQLAALAPAYGVNAVADSVTGLDPRSIVMLLAYRRLAFVEIKVLPGANGKPSNGQSKSPSDPGWPVDYLPGSYAKIELAAANSGACDAAATLPLALRDSLSVSPLAATHCIKTSNSPQPTARHVVDYQADPSSMNGLLGYYRLLDTQNNNTMLARLLTADQPGQAISEIGVSIPSPSFERPGCREPFIVLMDRLFKEP